jgi:peptidoglycan glycosyltransferase
MSRSLRHVTTALLAAFAALAALLGWWSSIGPELTTRNDNPRRIFAEQHIQRGPIVDRTDRVLAESRPVSGTFIRRYPLIDTASAVGYYSINYGLAGLEEAFDRTLRGTTNPIDQLLHRPQIGAGVRTTLDAALTAQVAARLTEPGAVVVLSVPDGQVLAMASFPTYDPNTLDADWKTLSTDPAAPLLNRATQGLYQPGAILQTVLLAEALERGAATLTQTLPDLTAPVSAGELSLKCTYVTQPVTTVVDAYINACPAFFANYGLALGETELLSITQKWGLTEPAPLEIRTAAAPTLTVALSTTAALQAYAAGQGELTVTPLHLARMAVAIGNGGSLPAGRLVSEVQLPDGTWSPTQPVGAEQRIISISTAKAMLTAMHTIDGVTGHGGAAYSGRKKLSWFIGLAPADAPRYAIAVLLENPPGNLAAPAEALGRAILQALLP